MQRINSRYAGKHTYCVTVVITEKTRQTIIPTVIRHCDNLNTLSVLKREVEDTRQRILPMYPGGTDVMVGFLNWIELVDDIPDEES